MRLGMISGIKDMIARCMGRMREGACATCDNRKVCPAGRWQQAFGPPGKPEGSSFFAFLGEIIEAVTRPAQQPRCFRKDVEDAIGPMLETGHVGIERVA